LQIQISTSTGRLLVLTSTVAGLVASLVDVYVY